MRSDVLEAATNAVDTPTRREIRAVHDYLVPQQLAPGLWRVYSEDGTERTVDSFDEACDCEDYQYRQPLGGCKHIRFIRFVIGIDDLPAVEIRNDVEYYRDYFSSVEQRDSIA